MPTVDHGNLGVLPTRLSHNADSDSSVDTTRDNSIYFRNSPTVVTLESQQVHSSGTDLPKSYDLPPRLPPGDYHEKVIQNKTPPKMRCIPISEPAASSNQLTQSQKRDVIFHSCHRTHTLPSSSEIQTDPNVLTLILILNTQLSQHRLGIQNVTRRNESAIPRKTYTNAYQVKMTSMQSLTQVYIQNFVFQSNILTATTHSTPCFF